MIRRNNRIALVISDLLFGWIFKLTRRAGEAISDLLVRGSYNVYYVSSPSTGAQNTVATGIFSCTSRCSDFAKFLVGWYVSLRI